MGDQDTTQVLHASKLVLYTRIGFYMQANLCSTRVSLIYTLTLPPSIMYMYVCVCVYIGILYCIIIIYILYVCIYTLHILYFKYT